MFNVIKTMHDEALNDFFYAGLTNIENADSAKKIHIDLPGVKKEDVNMKIDGNILLVEGERKGFLKNKYKKSYTLSNEFDLEKISAELLDGVLIITVPHKDKKMIKNITIK